MPSFYCMIKKQNKTYLWFFSNYPKMCFTIADCIWCISFYLLEQWEEKTFSSELFVYFIWSSIIHVLVCILFIFLFVCLAKEAKLLSEGTSYLHCLTQPINGVERLLAECKFLMTTCLFIRVQSTHIVLLPKKNISLINMASK